MSASTGTADGTGEEDEEETLLGPSHESEEERTRGFSSSCSRVAAGQPTPP